ncbi:MAG: membrane dipeptidase [Armatimonadota bacterium]
MSARTLASNWFALDEAQEARARKIHGNALVIDCLGGHIVNPEPPPMDGAPYLDRLIASGVRADHMDYIVQLAGPDHVGIGTDVFESYTKVSWEAQTKRMYRSQWVYETMLSDGFTRITDLPNVTRGLVARGYSDADIFKILGGNWLRVFRQVWSKARTVA